MTHKISTATASLLEVVNDSTALPADRIAAAKAVLSAQLPDASTSPSAAELVEYRRLTLLIEDVERRRLAIALLRHGYRRNPDRLALLDDRERQLYEAGAALVSIRAPLYLRVKRGGRSRDD